MIGRDPCYNFIPVWKTLFELFWAMRQKIFEKEKEKEKESCK